MIYPSADKLENWGSKYALATLAAKRAKQIKSGAPALVDTDSRNALTIALEEIASGRVTCEVPDIDALPTVAIEPEVAQLLSMPMETDDEAEELVGGSLEAGVDDDLEAAEGADEEDEHVGWEDDEEEDADDILHPLGVEEEDESVPAVLLGVDDDAVADDNEPVTKIVDDAAEVDIDLAPDVEDSEEEAGDPDEEEA